MRAADRHHQRLLEQADGIAHHRALLRVAVSCLGAVVLIIFLASLAA